MVSKECLLWSLPAIFSISGCFLIFTFWSAISCTFPIGFNISEFTLSCVLALCLFISLLSVQFSPCNFCSVNSGYLDFPKFLNMNYIRNIINTVSYCLSVHLFIYTQHFWFSSNIRLVGLRKLLLGLRMPRLWFCTFHSVAVITVIYNLIINIFICKQSI